MTLFEIISDGLKDYGISGGVFAETFDLIPERHLRDLSRILGDAATKCRVRANTIQHERNTEKGELTP